MVRWVGDAALLTLPTVLCCVWLVPKVAADLLLQALVCRGQQGSWLWAWPSGHEAPGGAAEAAAAAVASVSPPELEAL